MSSACNKRWEFKVNKINYLLSKAAKTQFILLLIIENCKNEFIYKIMQLLK